ncbi:hypothetical protein EVAR_5638_1 [Eumeta japonica]|uniref:Uncharacterized protein n=1 Tax=Eumeta variegata TaxID=151549 RepID=A0A4C1T9S7_EUMVA|nr:hypothetical protein EVAR_5638_1 [Eumeta japonica]
MTGGFGLWKVRRRDGGGARVIPAPAADLHTQQTDCISITHIATAWASFTRRRIRSSGHVYTDLTIQQTPYNDSWHVIECTGGAAVCVRRRPARRFARDGIWVSVVKGDAPTRSGTALQRKLAFSA